MSFFEAITEAPADPILGLNAAFNNDPSPNKVNLGVGAYRDASGKPYVLPVVRRIEQELAADPKQNHEYIPIDGLPAFRDVTASLILGADSPAILEKRISVSQALSGTGALRLGMAFIKAHLPQSAAHPILLSDPTWGNHQTIATHSGLKWAYYPYWDDATKGLAFDKMLAALRAAPPHTVVVLHPCAHNPTGVDPTREQWDQIADVMAAGQLLPFFDCAYQGYATGDLTGDAYSVRAFVKRGFEMFITQSYAKNIGLYGERIGAIHIVTKTADQAMKAHSQMKIIIRGMYSSPPAHGAQIVAAVLGNKKNWDEWEADLKAMAKRIQDMRARLRGRLEEIKAPGTWHHITDQIGMFSYTGLNAAQCKILTEQFHIYLVNNGRISMAGINEGNVSYVADAIAHAVTHASL